MTDSHDRDKVSHSFIGRDRPKSSPGFNCTNFLNNFSLDSVGDSGTRHDIIYYWGRWTELENILTTYNMCGSPAHDNYLHVMGISYGHLVNQYLA